MSFFVVEAMTFCLDNRIHSVIMLYRSYRVFDIPTFESDTVISNRTNLYKDRRTVIHGCCSLVVHVFKIRSLVGNGGNRPLQCRGFYFRLRLDNNCVCARCIAIIIAGNFCSILVED